MRVLYTGFKGKNNSSYQLLSKILGEKLFLTNSFEGLKKDIMNVKDSYDMVVMFGLDISLKDTVRIECVAELDGIERVTKISCDEICRCLTVNEVRCAVSNIPTQYLCNAAYFHMLQKVSGKALFIHVPSTKNMSEKLTGEIVKCMEELKDEYRIQEPKRFTV